MKLVESNLFPDCLIRMAIRAIIEKSTRRKYRARREDREVERLALLDRLRQSPIAVDADQANRQHNDEKELRKVSTDNVLEVMMTALHIDDDDIQNRQKGNVHRKIFIYILRKHTALSLREIEAMLGMKYRQY